MKLNQTKSSKPRQNPQRSHQSFTPPAVSTRSIPVTTNKKYSDWFQHGERSEARATEPTGPPNDDLLSHELLTEMMIELFKGLRSSKTRLDQIQTVASVVLKYMHMSNND